MVAYVRITVARHAEQPGSRRDRGTGPRRVRMRLYQMQDGERSTASAESADKLPAGSSTTGRAERRDANRDSQLGKHTTYWTYRYLVAITSRLTDDHPARALRAGKKKLKKESVRGNTYFSLHNREKNEKTSCPQHIRAETSLHGQRVRVLE